MENSMNLMKYKIWYLVFSAVVLIPGIFFLVVYGLRLSIDFTGGSDFNYEYNQTLNEQDLRSVFSSNGIDVERIVIANNTVNIRTKPVESSKIDTIKGAISQKFGSPKLLSFETVGPSIGSETTKNAFVALFWASLGILLYIAYAFRNIPKPYSSFRFGVSAIVAMLHDAFVVLGIFAILSHFLKIEIDSLFITAILTVIGFSVHDTIVVFDRIRENLNKLPNSWSFESVVNFSVVETLNRSIATSLTVIMTLLSLYLLGGQSIKEFVLAMLIGIVSGTYSSIFNASPILVLWEEYVVKYKKK
jgi:preprotein translocase subunit SecF